MTIHAGVVTTFVLVALPSDARSHLYTVRTDNAPKVRFSAPVGQEPEIEVALIAC